LKGGGVNVEGGNVERGDGDVERDDEGGGSSANAPLRLAMAPTPANNAIAIRFIAPSENGTHAFTDCPNNALANLQ
jgi:hypothetical protein